ncbi:hypothetical protein T11_2116 [Trichinella zimbabwensis]|uniref:Uncharacterized protein n=1 Tax=Trichinella zimbabwensis TaxID=268475 RepID=A0A0V1GWJ1_9BILA|nr:hypothetical protein T11_2116 [Trichinella zimbabwensis]
MQNVNGCQYLCFLWVHNVLHAASSAKLYLSRTHRLAGTPPSQDCPPVTAILMDLETLSGYEDIHHNKEKQTQCNQLKDLLEGASDNHRDKLHFGRPPTKHHAPTPTN